MIPRAFFDASHCLQLQLTPIRYKPDSFLWPTIVRYGSVFKIRSIKWGLVKSGYCDAQVFCLKCLRMWWRMLESGKRSQTLMSFEALLTKKKQALEMVAKHETDSLSTNHIKGKCVYLYKRLSCKTALLNSGSLMSAVESDIRNQVHLYEQYSKYNSSCTLPVISKPIYAVQ